MKYQIAVKDYFYRNTSHRQYLSKFVESVMSAVLKGLGADPVKSADAGKYVDKTKVVEDIMGNRRQIGSGEWVKSTNVRPGRADIKCFFDGVMGVGMYNLEVKIKKDSMSEKQHLEKIRAEANGEFYIIIKTVDDFINVLK